VFSNIEVSKNMPKSWADAAAAAKSAKAAGAAEDKQQEGARE
jgi:hypothetical protein